VTRSPAVSSVLPTDPMLGAAFWTGVAFASVPVESEAACRPGLALAPVELAVPEVPGLRVSEPSTARPTHATTSNSTTGKMLRRGFDGAGGGGALA
jgi:hypothetical protein